MSALDALFKAVAAGDAGAVMTLVAKQGQVGHEYAAGLALECGHETLAEDIRGHAPAFNRYMALTWAASQNWRRAAQQWLAQGATQEQPSLFVSTHKKAREEHEALGIGSLLHPDYAWPSPAQMAVFHGHLDFLRDLLAWPLDDSHVQWQVASALFLATDTQNKEALALLWPRGTPDDQGDVFLRASQQGSEHLIEELLTWIDPTKPPNICPITHGFIWAIKKHMDLRVLTRWLPWTDPHAEREMPLRVAFEADYPEAAALLLPVSDPEKAMMGWLIGTNPRRDMIKRLFLCLSDEKQERLFQEYPEEMLDAWVTKRAQTAHNRMPEASRARRRS